MTTPARDKRTILLVDDHHELLQTMSEMLCELGDYAVVTAEDGAQGLKQFVQAQPDCVVIDVKMPELDGYQVVRALRGDPHTAGVPLIILSALSQRKDAYAGYLSGADRYLNKPVTPSELIAVIHEVMSLDATERLRQQLANIERSEPDPA